MATNPRTPYFIQNDGPGKKECDLEIENDEQDRHQVVANVEFHASVFEGLETTLVRGEFFRVRVVRAEDPSHRKQHNPEAQGDAQKNQDGYVVLEHQELA